eukprot:358695-Chlamydomonas_euryale.AAC.1
MGASHLCGVLYSQLTKYTGPASATARANSQRAIADLALAAKPLGVTICLEVVNRSADWRVAGWRMSRFVGCRLADA